MITRAIIIEALTFSGDVGVMLRRFLRGGISGDDPRLHHDFSAKSGSVPRTCFPSFPQRFPMEMDAQFNSPPTVRRTSRRLKLSRSNEEARECQVRKIFIYSQRKWGRFTRLLLDIYTPKTNMAPAPQKDFSFSFLTSVSGAKLVFWGCSTVCTGICVGCG